MEDMKTKTEAEYEAEAEANTNANAEEEGQGEGTVQLSELEVFQLILDGIRPFLLKNLSVIFVVGGPGCGKGLYVLRFLWLHVCVCAYDFKIG